ncbi:hypothetical protein MLGJGCBP_00008 [Rhodococcus sp. T7]|nr:hypothetical protein MLGJGCBP_09039 [Rhodococcus sp. T7]KAF0966813.1 hypothetical protein MLGJGCBP_00008 [Rhodococcus sp. T7]
MGVWGYGSWRNGMKFSDDRPGERYPLRTLTTKDGNMLAARQNNVSVATLALCLTVLSLSTACGVPDENQPSTDASETTRDVRCQQFESFSGQLTVGNPRPRRTGLVPLIPGENLPVRVLPSLDSVELEGTPDGEIVTFKLGGDGSVGWSARFVQMPLLRGTDGAVQISGSCILQIDLTSVDSNQVSEIPGRPIRITPDGDASAVVEVLSYPSSDSVAQSFAGTRSSTPKVTVDTSIDNRVITVAITH